MPFGIGKKSETVKVSEKAPQPKQEVAQVKPQEVSFSVPNLDGFKVSERQLNKTTMPIESMLHQLYDKGEITIPIRPQNDDKAIGFPQGSITSTFFNKIRKGFVVDGKLIVDKCDTNDYKEIRYFTMTRPSDKARLFYIGLVENAEKVARAITHKGDKETDKDYTARVIAVLKPLPLETEDEKTEVKSA